MSGKINGKFEVILWRIVDAYLSKLDDDDNIYIA